MSYWRSTSVEQLQMQCTCSPTDSDPLQPPYRTAQSEEEWESSTPVFLDRLDIFQVSRTVRIYSVFACCGPVRSELISDRTLLSLVRLHQMHGLQLCSEFECTGDIHWCQGKAVWWSVPRSWSGHESAGPNCSRLCRVLSGSRALHSATLRWSETE